jgi:transcription termination factor NusB
MIKTTTIKIKDSEYIVKTGYAAIFEWESITNKSLSDLLKIKDEDNKITDFLIRCYAMLKGYNEHFKFTFKEFLVELDNEISNNENDIISIMNQYLLDRQSETMQALKDEPTNEKKKI